MPAQSITMQLQGHLIVRVIESVEGEVCVAGFFEYEGAEIVKMFQVALDAFDFGYVKIPVGVPISLTPNHEMYFESQEPPE